MLGDLSNYRKMPRSIAGGFVTASAAGIQRVSPETLLSLVVARLTLPCLCYNRYNYVGVSFFGDCNLHPDNLVF